MDIQHSALGEALTSDDHTHDIVPLSERRSPLMLGLLWITMVTGFPMVLAGFEWFKHGLTITQVLICAVLSNIVLLAYSIPACHLGAIGGQTYALMSRSIFGRVGSVIVSIKVAFIAVAWYGLIAYLLASGLKGIFPIPIDIVWLSFILGILMSVNNLFGFTGVANFASYLAAPVLIFWIAATFLKAGSSMPMSVFSAPATVPMPHALTLVSALIMGNGAWGNEADYWRYAKPRLANTVAPLVVAIAIGQIIFPITGWLLARETGITDYEAASGLMIRYAFGGAALFAALILVVTYYGLNDANLYAAINGIANLKRWPRTKLTLAITIIGAVAAAILSLDPNSFEKVCSLSCTVLPCATMVMIAEWFCASRAKNSEPFYTRVPEFSELPTIRWPAVIALLSGCLVGIVTAGIIPGLEAFYVGICSLQAWITTVVVYMILRPFGKHPGSDETVKPPGA